MLRSWALALGLTGACLISACIPDDVPPPKPQPASQASAAAPSGADAGASADQGTDTKSLLATVESMKGQLKDKPRGFNVSAALGNLFYDNGKFIDAIEYYSDALDRAAPAEKRIMELSAAGQLNPKAVVPDSCRLDQPTKDDVAQGNKAKALEEIVAAATALAPTDPAGEAACLGQLPLILANLHARRGNGWYLVGNADKARADHTAALALDPVNPEALFFSGALQFETAHGDPAKLAAGKAFWEKLLKVAPDHPRAQIVKETLPRVDQLFGPNANQGMAMAGHPPIDNQSAPPGGAAAPQLPAGMMEAMSNVQHTPEMDAQLDKTTADGEALLQQGKWQEALDMFKQVMPLRPSGKIALDLGIALRELGKPTAERVLTNATRMPGGDPVRAKYELAVYYEKHDPAQAKALYQEIQDDPKVGADAKGRLARLP
jgi:tetratricopeptide (TPR) repeat protein